MEGPIHPFTDIHLATLYFNEGGQVSFSVSEEKSIFLYVVHGELDVNGTDVRQHHLVEFASDDTEIRLRANTDAVALFGHAMPFREPLVAYGPFVMNTREEIEQAYADYHQGKFGNEVALS